MPRTKQKFSIATTAGRLIHGPHLYGLLGCKREAGLGLGVAQDAGADVVTYRWSMLESMT